MMTVTSQWMLNTYSVMIEGHMTHVVFQFSWHPADELDVPSDLTARSGRVFRPKETLVRRVSKVGCTRCRLRMDRCGWSEAGTSKVKALKC